MLNGEFRKPEVTNRQAPQSAPIRPEIRPFERYGREVLIVLFTVLAIWVLLSWTAVVQRVIRYYTPFPSWDYWRVIYDANFHKSFGFQIFLKPHNEHRIIFPEIIYQLDLLLRGRLILPIVCSFLFYAMTWVVLAYVIGRDGTISPGWRIFMVLLAGVILSWQGSAVVIADPFLLQWTLSNLCVAVAIFMLARSKTTNGAEALCIAMIAAVIATYSSGNCLTLWPVLALEAWILRLKRRQFITVLLTGLVSIALYFVDYHPDNNLKLLELIRHPLHALGFLTIYISMPFGAVRSDRFAIALGTVNLLFVGLLFVYARRRKLLQSETGICLLSIWLFLLFTGMLVTSGRITLSAGYGDAKASRFWCIQLFNWADFALLWGYFGAKSRFRLSIKVAGSAGLVMLLALGMLKLRPALNYDNNQFANRQFAALSFENGLEDPDFMRRTFPSPAFVRELLPYLRTRHLTVFSLQPFAWLGKPVAVAGDVSSEPRSGQVVSTLPVEGGVEIVGWAEPERNGNERIVLVNEDKKIVGFGQHLSAGLPSDLRSLAIPASEAWVAFINLRYGSHRVSPYFLSHGRLEPINASLSIDEHLRRVPEDVGVLFRNVEWHADPAWTINGYPRLPYAANVPLGTIYGSWSGDDRKEGAIISSPFNTPTTGCLLIPILHGALVQGLSIRVENAENGQLIRSIPLQNGDMDWQFWEITIDKPVSHLRIRAQDLGHDWGEWLAIAQPSQCESAAAKP